MLRFSPLSYRPSLGQALPALAPTINLSPAPAGAPVNAALGTGLSILSTAISAGGAWVGIHTGIKERGLLSFTGWMIGILSGVNGFLNLASSIYYAGLLINPPGKKTETL